MTEHSWRSTVADPIIVWRKSPLYGVVAFAAHASMDRAILDAEVAMDTGASGMSAISVAGRVVSVFRRGGLRGDEGEWFQKEIYRLGEQQCRNQSR